MLKGSRQTDKKKTFVYVDVFMHVLFLFVLERQPEKTLGSVSTFLLIF